MFLLVLGLASLIGFGIAGNTGTGVAIALAILCVFGSDDRP